MGKPINIYDAKTRLSKLVDRVARLVARRPPQAIRKAGRLRGRIRIRKNFDAPLPDDLFEN